MVTFLNQAVINSLEAPFAWREIEGCLEGFSTLCRDFPSLALFEFHQGLVRKHGQRPHNRYYLAYESSPYEEPGLGRSVSSEDLAPSWQEFIAELQSDLSYHRMISSLLGPEEGWQMRFAWHVGTKGSEVSPHLDGREKLATHIFYFNSSHDWDLSWGGEMLVLEGKMVDKNNPDFEEFADITPCQIVDNRSFLFKNSPTMWHGVRPLRCPEGKYRRLFNVIFEGC